MKSANGTCDFGPNCANLKNAFGPSAAAGAIEIVRSSPHLAEALVNAGLVSACNAVNMALALQEARQCPLPSCPCTIELPTDRQGEFSMKLGANMDLGFFGHKRRRGSLAAEPRANGPEEGRQDVTACVA